MDTPGPLEPKAEGEIPHTPLAPPAGFPAVSTHFTLGSFELDVDPPFAFGSFGAICVAKDSATQERYALKSAPLHRRSLWEAEILSEVTSPFVLRVYGSWSDVSKQVHHILLELCDGTLAGYLGERDEASVMAIFAQIICGVQALHAHGIVHCDLKPQNVLFVRNQSVVPFIKLADLGSSQRIDVAIGPKHEGTLAFLAPECILGAPASFASDVWGLGCILYSLCTGSPPFDGAIGVLIAGISTATYTPLRRDLFSAELIFLVDSMLTVSPSSRATIADIFSSPLLATSLQFLSELYEGQASHL